MPDSAHPRALVRRVRTLNFLRIFFSVLAVGLILLGLYTMRETSRSRGWVNASAKVVASNVNEFAGKNGRTYRPMIVFSYSVGSVRYMSSRLAFHPLVSSNRNDAARIVAKYPVASTVSVRYDPTDPEQAVLEPGSNPWIPIVAGGACSMLAVWMRILRGRAEKQARNA